MEKFQLSYGTGGNANTYAHRTLVKAALYIVATGWKHLKYLLNFESLELEALNHKFTF